MHSCPGWFFTQLKVINTRKKRTVRELESENLILRYR